MAEFPALKEAQNKLNAARKALYDVMQESQASGKGYDMDAIKSVSGSKDDKLAWIRSKNEEINGLKGEVDKLGAVAAAASLASEYAPEQKGSENGAEVKGSVESGDPYAQLSDLMVKSAAWQTKGRSASLDFETKNLFYTAGGWTPQTTRSGLVTLKPMVPAPSVVDHLVSIPINQAAYKYMEETTYTNAAVETGESTQSTAATYQESALALTERSQVVQKIATWIPVTDEQLEDEPGARAYIESRLQNMMRQRLDLQVLAGTGDQTGLTGAGNSQGTQLLGTVNKAGIQTRSQGADTVLDAAFKLFTTIRTDGFAEPSVAFLRPTSWQDVALLKTADGIYIYGNPTTGAPSVLWGVPVVQTMAAPANTMVTGDYANYAFLGIRRGLDMQITNSHSTHFIEGKQAIRVDMRCVMVHVRPKAFGTLTGLAN